MQTHDCVFIATPSTQAHFHFPPGPAHMEHCVTPELINVAQIAESMYF